MPENPARYGVRRMTEPYLSREQKVAASRLVKLMLGDGELTQQQLASLLDVTQPLINKAAAENSVGPKLWKAILVFLVRHGALREAKDEIFMRTFAASIPEIWTWDTLASFEARLPAQAAAIAKAKVRRLSPTAVGFVLTRPPFTDAYFDDENEKFWFAMMEKEAAKEVSRGAAPSPTAFISKWAKDDYREIASKR